MTKTVLLYGDSILWGVDATSGGRHHRTDRVDSIIQQVLGQNIEVISEGLRGRTLFGENGFFPKRNGEQQFGPIFASHLPIDVLVIMLGTNDTNSKTRHSGPEIADSLGLYQSEAKEWCDFMGYAMPKILIVSPLDIDEEGLGRFSEIFAESAPLIAVVAASLQAYSSSHEHDFLDARLIAKSVGTDGIHLDVVETKKLADEIAMRVKTIIG